MKLKYLMEDYMKDGSCEMPAAILYKSIGVLTHASNVSGSQGIDDIEKEVFKHLCDSVRGSHKMLLDVTQRTINPQL